jgi:hypothetical protein
MSYTFLKKAVMKFKTLEVDDENGKTTTYKLALDMNAIAAAYEDIGKDFAKFETWTTDIPSPEVLKLFWYSLKRFHPDVTFDEAGSWLNPEVMLHITNQLWELAFPGIVAQLSKAKENTPGEDQPNPSGEASVVA